MKLKQWEVASVTPDSIKINLAEMQQYESDALCRTIINATIKMFKNPQVQADYEVWLERKYGKRVQNG
jgi:EAL domain-containing protein (putative c-di-GMP-specific phosphodiesterase class I)